MKQYTIVPQRQSRKAVNQQADMRIPTITYNNIQ